MGMSMGNNPNYAEDPKGSRNVDNRNHCNPNTVRRYKMMQSQREMCAQTRKTKCTLSAETRLHNKAIRKRMSWQRWTHDQVVLGRCAQDHVQVIF